MIELEDLTRHRGATAVVDGITATIPAGQVTGFLGPNGAGKSTTMRLILGLERPTRGQATVRGVAYRQLAPPLQHVGALLDADAVHPGRSGRDHLRTLARSNGISTARVDHVLEQVGLASAARHRTRTYSLGMRQRLGIAAALLGDPPVLLFDEPVNGLDPEGVRWIRTLLRRLAAEGRTVLVSSHLMSEMEATADRLLVLGRGRVLAEGPLDAVLAGDRPAVRVRSPAADELAARIRVLGGEVADGPTRDELLVHGLDAAAVGDLAAAGGHAVHALVPLASSLEGAYLRLTADHVEHRSGTARPDVARATTPTAAIGATR